MKRYFAVVPLLAALAVAQSDRVVVVKEPGFFAEAYGLHLLEKGVLTSELKLVSSPAGLFLYPIVPDPTPDCHLTLFVGSGETRLDLFPIGIDGWLLVDPIFAHVTVPLRDPIVLPRGPHLVGNDFYLQTVLVRVDPVTYEFEFSFSHGLMLSFYAP